MNLSIVIPVYNSESIVSRLIEEIENAIKSYNLEFEVVLINDCSADDSWEMIKKLSKKKNFIKEISLKNNYGQHNAISAGLNYTEGKFIVLMDDDLQHDPRYIVKIFNVLNKGYDSCYVKYIKRKHVFWKRSVSFFNHLISSFLSSKSLNIYTSSFKGFNRNICEIIKKDKEFEVFLDWLIVENSKKIETINVVHRERYTGRTNYNLNKLFILWSNMIMKINPKNNFKKLLIFIIKLCIENIIYKIVSKKKYTEKFLISEKTF